MSRKLTKAALDRHLKHGCSNPDCEGHEHEIKSLYLHSRCHPGYPTWVRYNNDGTLTMECAKCDKVVCTIEVKEVQ